MDPSGRTIALLVLTAAVFTLLALPVMFLFLAAIADGCVEILVGPVCVL